MTRKDEQALAKLGKLKGPFRAQEAEAAGIPRWRLRELAKTGALTELGRGLYQKANTSPTAELDYVAVKKLAPSGAVCLNSALAYWDLTDEIPRRIHIAVPRNTHRPQISYPPVKVHEFDAETFELEQREIETPGGDFTIYSAERSIVDAFRMQKAIGRDQALAAIRRYMDWPRRDPSKLLQLATKLRARTAVQQSLELLLS